MSLIRERATFLTDLWDLAHFFFEAPTQYDAKALKKQWKDNSAQILNGLVIIIKELTDLKQFKDFIAQEKLNLGQVMPLIRLSFSRGDEGARCVLYHHYLRGVKRQ